MKQFLPLLLIVPAIVLALLSLPYDVVGEDYVQVDYVEVQEIDAATSRLMLSSGAESLTMVISQSQGESIDMGFMGLHGSRPNTHDLQAGMLEASGVAVLAVTIDELAEGYYTATIYLKNFVFTKGVDCRPSDCVAIAARTGAPVYVKQQLFDVVAEEPEEVIPA